MPSAIQRNKCKKRASAGVPAGSQQSAVAAISPMEVRCKLDGAPIRAGQRDRQETPAGEVRESAALASLLPERPRSLDPVAVERRHQSCAFISLATVANGPSGFVEPAPPATRACMPLRRGCWVGEWRAACSRKSPTRSESQKPLVGERAKTNDPGRNKRGSLFEGLTLSIFVSFCFVVVFCFPQRRRTTRRR